MGFRGVLAEDPLSARRDAEVAREQQVACEFREFDVVRCGDGGVEERVVAWRADELPDGHPDYGEVVPAETTLGTEGAERLVGFELGGFWVLLVTLGDGGGCCHFRGRVGGVGWLVAVVMVVGGGRVECRVIGWLAELCIEVGQRTKN